MALFLYVGDNIVWVCKVNWGMFCFSDSSVGERLASRGVALSTSVKLQQIKSIFKLYRQLLRNRSPIG